MRLRCCDPIVCVTKADLDIEASTNSQQSNELSTNDARGCVDRVQRWYTRAASCACPGHLSSSNPGPQLSYKTSLIDRWIRLRAGDLHS